MANGPWAAFHPQTSRTRENGHRATVGFVYEDSFWRNTSELVTGPLMCIDAVGNVIHRRQMPNALRGCSDEVC